MTQTFEEYVTAYDAVCAEVAAIEAKLKPLKAKELEMRKAIAASLDTALGEARVEGVNRFPMQDGRTLKYSYKVDRKIEESEIANAREKYSKQNDTPVTFDQLLRVKYELSKRDWDKLPDAAKKAVSRMIVAKPATPSLEIE